MNFNEKYESLKTLFESELENFINGFLDGSKLTEGMAYSLRSGGKRVRPVLTLLVAECLGVDFKKVMPFAIAVECIHTYSLVHDDLPAMDNDDFRRGIPSSHKVYGEGLAILIGDALLNLGYETAIKASKDVYDLNALKVLSTFCGYGGLVGGQAVDIDTNKEINKEVFNYVYENKTTKLLTCCTLIPSCLCGDKYISELKDYGRSIGFLFQAVDDLLDYDTENLELNIVNLYGLKLAKKLINEHYNCSLNCLKNIENSSYLAEFSKFLYNRKN